MDVTIMVAVTTVVCQPPTGCSGGGPMREYIYTCRLITTRVAVVQSNTALSFGLLVEIP